MGDSNPRRCYTLRLSKSLHYRSANPPKDSASRDISTIRARPPPSAVSLVLTVATAEPSGEHGTRTRNGVTRDRFQGGFLTIRLLSLADRERYGLRLPDFTSRASLTHGASRLLAVSVRRAGWNRTTDLQPMKLASYRLLYRAMLRSPRLGAKTLGLASPSWRRRDLNHATSRL